MKTTIYDYLEKIIHTATYTIIIGYKNGIYGRSGITLDRRHGFRSNIINECLNLPVVF